MRPSQRRDDLRQLVPARLAALTAQCYTWLQRQQTLETTSANCANPASQEGAARQCESGPHHRNTCALRESMLSASETQLINNSADVTQSTAWLFVSGPQLMHINLQITNLKNAQATNTKCKIL